MCDMSHTTRTSKWKPHFCVCLESRYTNIHTHAYTHTYSPRLSRMKLYCADGWEYPSETATVRATCQHPHDLQVSRAHAPICATSKTTSAARVSCPHTPNGAPKHIQHFGQHFCLSTHCTTLHHPTPHCTTLHHAATHTQTAAPIHTYKYMSPKMRLFKTCGAPRHTFIYTFSNHIPNTYLNSDVLRYSASWTGSRVSESLSRGRRGRNEASQHHQLSSHELTEVSQYHEISHHEFTEVMSQTQSSRTRRGISISRTH